MIIIQDKLENINVSEELSIALGMFDGVHRGHQKIIEQAVKSAKEKNIKSAVITFTNHPKTVLLPNYQMELITDNNVKANIIESLGVDYLFFIDFNKDFADIEDVDFIKFLKNKFKSRVISCGFNYTFGKYGKGNPILLNYYRDKLNYEVNVVEKLTLNNLRISSTAIREKFRAGNIKDANQLLGYNYFCIGRVNEGKKIGNKLGFATANIKIPHNLCLKNGVYITLTYINNKVYPSISNVGYTPTIKIKDRVIETHIIDFKDDIYGEEIRVEFLDFIRDERKFDSIEALKDRVFKDLDYAKEYFINNLVYNRL